MSHLEPPEDPGKFGLDFNYALWTAGTTVTLCNVPWYSDYRDVVFFDTQAELDKYLDSAAGPSISLQNMMHARPGHPVRINVPFNNAYQYNYLRVHNPKQPVGENSAKTFYYFISDVRYVAPNTTELIVQLDVWQTFIRTIDFGRSYVERGHIGIANSNQMHDYGRRYLAIPEGLDLGSEYEHTNFWSHTIANVRGNDSYKIVVVSTVSLEDSGGTVDEPVLETARGTYFEGLPNGVSTYVLESMTQFIVFMSAISKVPWVSQGIIGIYAVPSFNLNDFDFDTVKPDWYNEVSGFLRVTGQARMPREKITLKKNFRDEIRSRIPQRYRHLSKFLTYPYCVIELTTNSGNPLMLKPESVAGDDFDIVKLMHIMQPSPRLAIYPFRYNASGHMGAVTQSGEVFHDRGEFLDMATGIFDFPTFSITNNSYISFMASNRNQINYQHSQADWSQTRALGSNQVAYGQASEQMALQQRLNQHNVSAMGARTDLANTVGGQRALLSGVSSVGQGMMTGSAIGVTGGVMSAAMAGANHAIDVNERNQSLGIESSLANRNTRAQVDTAGYIRDTNKEFADYAARGDYEQAVAGINARVQDAKLIQPTTSGQIGGDAFNLAVYQWSADARVKMVTSGAMAAIGEYWLRYGYRVNRFMQLPKNLKAMSKFTYWKLMETYLSSSRCPESFRQTIRGILEKGVTVWSDPDDIGRIDVADNRPLSGVSY